MKLRQIAVDMLRAGDQVYDRVYGSTWTVTGTDGRDVTAVGDYGDACTIRVRKGDHLLLIMPLP